MKIDDTSLSGASAPQTSQSSATQGAQRSEAAQRERARLWGGNDQVDLSSETNWVQKAMESSSVDRAGRIEQLTLAVQSDQYVVDADQVSKAVLDGSLTLR